MRYAIVSDIHGNITGMKAVLESLKSKGTTDKIIVAGDIVSGSSGSSDLIKLLADIDADIIRGNIEDFLADPENKIENVSPKFRNYMMAWYAWLKDRLSESEWSLLINSPLSKTYKIGGNSSILVCHAAPDNPWSRTCRSDNPAEVLADAYGKYQDDIIVYGHFHEQHKITMNNKTLVNAASVGLRKDGKCNFTIIDDSQGTISIQQYSVPYDESKEIKLNNKCGIPSFESLVNLD